MAWVRTRGTADRVECWANTAPTGVPELSRAACPWGGIRAEDALGVGRVAWRDVVRFGMVWYGVVWYGMVWCGVVWCGVVWFGVVWCGVVSSGAVWCGVVWCGVVWCGVVWYGVV